MGVTTSQVVQLLVKGVEQREVVRIDGALDRFVQSCFEMPDRAVDLIALGLPVVHRPAPTLTFVMTKGCWAPVARMWREGARGGGVILNVGWSASRALC